MHFARIGACRPQIYVADFAQYSASEVRGCSNKLIVFFNVGFCVRNFRDEFRICFGRTALNYNPIFF
jgi:hypothetical protein